MEEHEMKAEGADEMETVLQSWTFATEGLDKSSPNHLDVAPITYEFERQFFKPIPKIIEPSIGYCGFCIVRVPDTDTDGEDTHILEKHFRNTVETSGIEPLTS